MHVGKPSVSCPSLKVDGKVMQSVEKETYLGDILTSDGKLNENVKERYNKGLGIVNQILAILKEVSFCNFI